MAGQIITFYSFKGGTGRTMAVANIACLLAASGQRVLIIDWDLEAPGLHRYFAPFLADPDLEKTQGLADILWSYTELSLTERASWPTGIDDPLKLADAQRHAIPVDFPLGDSPGVLHLLAAGQQGQSYPSRIQNFDWHAFYERLGGRSFFDSFRSRLLAQYDYVLIDSRTGLNDTAGICTVQLPDKVVLCFTYNRQSIQGIDLVASAINGSATRDITLLPVAMRVERGSRALIEPARSYAHRTLNPYLPLNWESGQREEYWANCEIGYYPDYAFQETLALIQEEHQRRGTLLSDFRWLATELSEGAPISVPSLSKTDRQRYQSLFALERSLTETTAKVEVPIGRAHV